MPDRVPIPTVVGGLSASVGIDLPIGSVGVASVGLSQVFFMMPAVSALGDVVAEIRDGTQALHTLTITQGQRSAQGAPATVPIVSPSTALFLRITAAPSDANDLSGWYELDGATGPSAALTDLARVKRFINETANSIDTLISELIAAVSKEMQNFMRQQILQASFTGEKQDGTGFLDVLNLNHFPLISVEQVKEDDTVLATTDYELVAEDGQLVRVSSGHAIAWNRGRRNIEVDYTHGYAVVPDDLQHAATLQVAYQLTKSGSKGGRIGQRSESIGDGTATYIMDRWVPETKATMLEYRERRRRAA